MKHIAGLALTALLASTFTLHAPAQTTESITIDAHAPTTPFPHFWEQTFGSGRAILSLRESYRNDLRTVKQITDFDSVRFHGIFMDEVGLYDPDRKTHHLRPDASSGRHHATPPSTTSPTSTRSTTACSPTASAPSSS